jgi:hypothetical protein
MTKALPDKNDKAEKKPSSHFYRRVFVRTVNFTGGLLSALLFLDDWAFVLHSKEPTNIKLKVFT